LNSYLVCTVTIVCIVTVVCVVTVVTVVCIVSEFFCSVAACVAALVSGLVKFL